MAKNNDAPEADAPGSRGNLGWKLTPPGPGQYPVDPARHLNDSERQIYALALEKLHPGSGATESNPAVQAIYKSCLQLRLALPRDRAKLLEKMVLEAAEGMAGLAPLLKDEDLEEIAITGAKQPVWVYARGKGWMPTNLVFENEQVLIDLANQLARAHGRRLSFHDPRLSVPLADGSRLYAVMPPLTWNHTALTLRKFRPKVFTWTELVAQGTLDFRMAGILKACMQADMNVLFVGNTGSGKTSLLNCAAAEIPFNQRILVIEDTPEIRLQHPHCIRLVAPTGSDTAFSELVQDTLRMRPDRVIIGEARTASEIRAVFDAFSSGQAKGTYATFHGRSAQEALDRIRALGVGEFQWRALDLIVVLRRLSASDPAGGDLEKRIVTEIAQLSQGRLQTWVNWNADTKAPTWEFDGNCLKSSPLAARAKINHDRFPSIKVGRAKNPGTPRTDE